MLTAITLEKSPTERRGAAQGFWNQYRDHREGRGLVAGARNRRDLIEWWIAA